jgi:hypothetical protein
MSDSSLENLKGFEERIKRIEGAKRSHGRVSRKSSGEYFRKEEERRRQNKKRHKANWTLRILLMLACFMGVKTYIMVRMGPEAYDARMAELQAGDRYHVAAFYVMQRDPVSAKLQQVFENYAAMQTSRVAEPVAAEADAANPLRENALPQMQEADSNGVEPASGSSNSDSSAN